MVMMDLCEEPRLAAICLLISEILIEYTDIELNDTGEKLWVFQ
jgi:hypothetical protein